MEDHDNSVRPPPPVYQLPDWETPRPRAAKRQSFTDRLLQSSRNSFGATFASTNYAGAAAGAGEGPAEAASRKEISAESSILPTHTQQASNVDQGTAKPSLLASARSRFDTAVPPHRTYFGRSRRFLLLFIILPLAILLFIVLPLAVGLGVGLSRRSKHSQDLPLPGNADVHTGDLTYYGPGLGACGVVSTSSDNIVSVSHYTFDAASTGSNPNNNPLCGKKIRVQRDFVEDGKGNRSVDVTVVDRCVGCAPTDLDLSIAVFTQLAPEDSGRVVGSWAWLD
ncbi:Uu.00g062470.m01.CDS01 [Anthostomella pinea]|uniref:Uu.00g062470.m01.CDS01 n=1 Tax=Anthostomella pinea TaxID=933095 RepID=A0AAI8YKH6_9PEZI|nr:Uu.00g062470.m01.CDS01 [Anthostomella pinea]